MKLRYAFALAGMFALTACGGGDDGGNKVASINGPKPSESAPPGAANAGTDDDKMRAYAKCMREHGIDMPDPKPMDGGGTVYEAQPMPEGGMEKMNAASEACKKLLPNGGEAQKMDPAQLDKARKDAKCLREHGLDWPDPDEKQGQTMSFDVGNMEKMNAAMKACGMGEGMKTMPGAGGK